jgi:serine/threonine protein kinase
LPWKLFSRIILWFIQIGQGTYSNVYRAHDLEKEKIVASKKVHFDNLELESVKLKAMEILILKIVA